MTLALVQTKYIIEIFESSKGAWPQGLEELIYLQYFEGLWNGSPFLRSKITRIMEPISQGSKGAYQKNNDSVE